MKTDTPAIAKPQTKNAKRLLWALPTLLISLCLTVMFTLEISIPAPFFSVLVSVVVAGTYGGMKAGVLSAGCASAFLFFAYWAGFGPAELTAKMLNVVVGAGLFMFLGFRLGQIKDSSEAKQSEILAANEKLKASLLSETQEKNKKTAQIFESEEQLRMAVRVSGIGYYKWDYATGDCIYCSGQHAAHFGISAETFYELNKGRAPYTGNIHDDDKALFVDAVARIDGGEAILFEYRAVHPDGTVRFVRQITEPVFDDAGNQIEVVGSSIDLTDLREAEARLRQSQRIEAIGTLTGGVAHDFNNILAIILGNLELSLECADDATRQDYLTHAIRATNRGAGLTKNLLSFARRAHLQPSRLNINQIVLSTMNWGTRVLPESISINTTLMDGLWDSELDATSLENAIVNIVLNARDAMPDGGKVSIETANVLTTDQALSGDLHDLSPGRYVMLAIADTGQGMSPDVLEKIFEPFHTSKPFGEGSGLGLSMVEGFIKQSGGTVRVFSEPGVGTTFKLYFKAMAEQAVAKPPETQTTVEAHSSGKRILLVEDEDGVARVICQTLENAGYKVELATNGDEGLRVFTQSDAAFDLLLTDVIMPGTLQGPALAKAIRDIDPDLPCIFMSGYAADATIHGNQQNASDIRLMKPVRRAELLEAVAATLMALPPHEGADGQSFPNP
ncbi:MAG: ATP-binding protein [Pseudomonadota bacterium]